MVRTAQHKNGMPSDQLAGNFQLPERIHYACVPWWVKVLGFYSALAIVVLVCIVLFCI